MRTVTVPAVVLSLACCCLIIIACSSDTAPTESMPSAVSLSQQVVVGDRVTIKANCKGLRESLTTPFKFTFADVRVDFDEGLRVTLRCSPVPDLPNSRSFGPRHVSVVVDDVGGSWRVRITLIAGGADGLCRPFEGTTLPSGPLICTFLDSDLFETPPPDDIDKAFLESGVVVNMN